MLRQRHSPQVVIRTKALAVVPRRAGDRVADLERGALGTTGMGSGQPVGEATRLTIAGRGFSSDQEVAAGDFEVGTPAGSCPA